MQLSVGYFSAMLLMEYQQQHNINLDLVVISARDKQRLLLVEVDSSDGAYVVKAHTALGWMTNLRLNDLLTSRPPGYIVFCFFLPSCSSNLSISVHIR